MTFERPDMIIIDDLLNKDEENMEHAEVKEYKNSLVIYHGNCADGFGAAWVFYNAQKKLFQTFDFHAGVYSDTPPDVKDRHIYLVDFSYKREVVEKMLEDAYHVTLIDHHKTALDDLAGLENSKFSIFTDIDRSGAILAWDFIYNTDQYGRQRVKPGDSDYLYPPRLLEHIQDRDLWKFKLPNTREIQANLFSHPYDFDLWTTLMEADAVELMKHTVAGAAIERKHHKDIKELVDVCRRFLPIGPYVVPVASLPYTLSSDAGHAMASEHKDGTEFAACYWDTPSHRIFSLRSCTNGVDVSEIAVEYGGGGHRNAAGFRVPRDHILARS